MSLARQRWWSVMVGIVLPAIAAIHAASPLPAQLAPTARDSIVALRAARAAKKTFDYQHYITVAQLSRKPKVSRFPATCEKVVEETSYCYGPTNGKSVLFSNSPLELKAEYAFATFGRIAERRKWALLRIYLAALDKSIAVIPGDQWLANERVWILLQHALPDSAVKAAAACKADKQFCAALHAYTLNEVGRHAASDSAWTRALALMDRDMRCRFMNDSGIIADVELRRTVANMGCDERAAFFEKLWWLADPLWSDSANERRAEQLSRRAVNIIFPHVATKSDSVLARLEREAVDVDQVAVRDDTVMQSLIFQRPRLAPFRPEGDSVVIERLGVPHATKGSYKEPYTTALYLYGHYQFLPNAHAIMNPLESEATDWNLHEPFPHERMGGLPRVFHWLEYQLAFFRRGDSARVVVATDVTRDYDYKRALVTTAIVLQRDPSAVPQVARSHEGPVYRFSIPAPSARTVASLEVLALGGVAGRLRFGVGPPENPVQRVAVSDILMVTPRDDLPATLDAAVPRAVGTHYIEQRSIGLFWEIYGLQSGETPHISVELREVPPGVLGRMVRSVFGRGGVRTSGTSWTEAAVSGRPIESRSLNLSLDEVRNGRHLMSVTVTVAGQQPVTSMREVEVLKRPRPR